MDRVDRVETPAKWGVCGFSLCQRRSKRHKTAYWYAHRKRHGKMEWVYVGRDPNRAEQKIQAWKENYA